MARRLGPPMAPERIGHTIDRRRIGLAAGDAIEVAWLAAGLDNACEQRPAVGDIRQAAPRQVHPRIRMLMVG